MKKKNKLGKYEKGVIITGVVVALILLILLTADGIKNIGKNNNPVGLSEQGETIVDTPDVPTLSAGMIPVKYNGDNLIICQNDNSWYNYSEGKPAYMMLNDGVYQSELVADMTNKKLASENIGQVVQPNEQGSIYMWIPRYAQNAVTGEIKYVPVEKQPGGDWELPETFSYMIADETKPDFSLSGVWVEKGVLANNNAVNTKVNNMTGENNTYGFIANTIGVAMTEEDKTIIGRAMLAPTSDTWLPYVRELDAKQTEGSFDIIDNQLNINRTVLKVIDEKHHEPIKAKIAYNETTYTIKIQVTYTKNGIAKIEDKNGNAVEFTNENGIITATVEAKSGKNHFTVIDNKGNKNELEVTAVLPIYAILYTDGTLAFTSSDKTIEGKTVSNSYGNIINKGNPWYQQRGKITTVDIVDEIAPLSTYSWFNECSNLTTVNNIENLDTSNVKEMTGMFKNCASLTKLDLSKFNTSNVIGMAEMFQFCSNLIELDISSFDTSNVENMSHMFYGCNSLEKLDVSNFSTSNVKYMDGMFWGCSGLTDLDLNNFDTSNVTNMSLMFQGCSSLIELNLRSFCTNNVVYMDSMFTNCTGIITLDLSSFNTANVVNMSYMFASCNSLRELNISNFDTSSVTNMQAMFLNCNTLIELDLSNFDTRKVTDMNLMFCNGTNLKTIYVGENWKLANNRNNMFNGCGTSTTTLKK